MSLIRSLNIKKKNLSHFLLNTYLNARPNYELPIIACPSSSIPPPLPIFELPSISLLLRYYRAYTSVERITHKTAFDQPSVAPLLS